jgi:hypothetical protein
MIHFGILVLVSIEVSDLDLVSTWVSEWDLVLVISIIHLWVQIWALASEDIQVLVLEDIRDLAISFLEADQYTYCQEENMVIAE